MAFEKLDAEIDEAFGKLQTELYYRIEEIAYKTFFPVIRSLIQFEDTFRCGFMPIPFRLITFNDYKILLNYIQGISKIAGYQSEINAMFVFSIDTKNNFIKKEILFDLNYCFKFGKLITILHDLEEIEAGIYSLTIR